MTTEHEHKFTDMDNSNEKDQLINKAENYGYPNLDKLEAKSIDQIESSLSLFLTLFPCWLSDIYLGEKCYIPNNNSIWEKTSANRIKNLDSGEIKTTLNIRVNPL